MVILEHSLTSRSSLMVLSHEMDYKENVCFLIKTRKDLEKKVFKMQLPFLYLKLFKEREITFHWFSLFTITWKPHIYIVNHHNFQKFSV